MIAKNQVDTAGLVVYFLITYTVTVAQPAIPSTNYSNLRGQYVQSDRRARVVSVG